MTVPHWGIRFAQSEGMSNMAHTTTVVFEIHEFRGHDFEVEVEVEVEPAVRGSFRHDADSDIDYHGCDASLSGVESISVQVWNEEKQEMGPSHKATPEEAVLVLAWMDENAKEVDAAVAEAAEKQAEADADREAEYEVDCRADMMADRDADYGDW